MTPEQALALLAQMAAQAAMPKAAHVEAEKAILVLKTALEPK